ncbi:MAG: hypothetical protein JWO95_3341, partial [Verrucomicrobiales bacterium]|nr:hypothetical protein [Verrucomicrobiales bacterium]
MTITEQQIEQLKQVFSDASAVLVPDGSYLITIP